jgi:hypothetical protein
MRSSGQDMKGRRWLGASHTTSRVNVTTTLRITLLERAAQGHRGTGDSPHVCTVGRNRIHNVRV